MRDHSEVTFLAIEWVGGPYVSSYDTPGPFHHSSRWWTHLPAPPTPTPEEKALFAATQATYNRGGISEDEWVAFLLEWNRGIDQRATSAEQPVAE